MIRKCLARAHFDLVGSYEGFPFKDLFSETIDEESFYTLVGYSPTEGRSATENYDLLKRYYSKDSSAVTKMKSLSAKEKPATNRIYKPSTVAHPNLVRMLGAYFKNNDTLQVKTGDRYLLLSQYLDNLSVAAKDANTLAGYIDNPSFLGLIKSLCPEFVRVKGSSPTIGRDKFIVPVQLSEFAKDNIIYGAILQATTSFLDVPSQVYFQVVERAPHAQTLTNERYLEMVAWAQGLGTTVRGLYELCGLRYIDRVEYYKMYRALVYKIGKDSYRVLNEGSIGKNRSIALNKTAVNLLHKKGLLSDIQWDSSPDPFVVIAGDPVPLSMYLSMQGGS